MIWEKINRYSKLGPTNFLKKIIHLFIIKSFSEIMRRIKALKLVFYFNKWGIDCGNNIKIHGISFNVKIGDDLRINDNCSFEFSKESVFKVGYSCFISYGVIISCHKKILIGDYVQIGEYTSIRDTTHSYTSLKVPMKKQEDYSEEIIIGNDVWIGRGCIILPGSIIEDGVVIGANSVVKGTLKKNCIYAGSPVRFIKGR